jgi:NAD-dependent SIR2 family protein deacetylase
LELKANIPSDKVIECHGHFRTASCVECGAKSRIEYVRGEILKGQVPICQVCELRYKKRSFVKPDIVFFGEQLPDLFHDTLLQDIDQADLCLVLGTSLQVPPVAYIPEMLVCRKIFINNEAVDYFENLWHVFHAGDCDSSLMSIANHLGWENDLLDMYNSNKKEGENNSGKASK